MKTIAQQINWDFDRNDNLEIRDKNHNPIYFENRNGDWYKWGYDSNGNEIYIETFNGDWTKREYDSKNNLIYWRDSYGQWAKWEFDSNGNQIYHKDSYGYWSTREYDSNGNSIYFEDSDGYIINNRPKNEITIDVSGIENSGKSRVIFLLKKLLKEQKFNVQFDGGRDFDDESVIPLWWERALIDLGFNEGTFVGITNRLGMRGEEIKDWLQKNQEVQDYAILDDDSDILPEQIDKFYHCDGYFGLSPNHLYRIQRAFSGKSKYGHLNKTL